MHNSQLDEIDKKNFRLLSRKYEDAFYRNCPENGSFRRNYPCESEKNGGCRNHPWFISRDRLHETRLQIYHIMLVFS